MNESYGFDIEKCVFYVYISFCEVSRMRVFLESFFVDIYLGSYLVYVKDIYVIL